MFIPRVVSFCTCWKFFLMCANSVVVYEYTIIVLYVFLRHIIFVGFEDLPWSTIVKFVKFPSN